MFKYLAETRQVWSFSTAIPGDPCKFVNYPSLVPYRALVFSGKINLNPLTF